jgi:hypothetical protein
VDCGVTHAMTGAVLYADSSLTRELGALSCGIELKMLTESASVTKVRLQDGRVGFLPSVRVAERRLLAPLIVPTAPTSSSATTRELQPHPETGSGKVDRVVDVGRNSERGKLDPTNLPTSGSSCEELSQRLEALSLLVGQLERQVTSLSGALAALQQLQGPASASRLSSQLLSPAEREYIGAGSGHWIQEVSSNGKIITLEDGSTWDVATINQVETALWLPTTDILVRRAHRPFGGNMYELINKDDGETAYARYLGSR